MNLSNDQLYANQLPMLGMVFVFNDTRTRLKQSIIYLNSGNRIDGDAKMIELAQEDLEFKKSAEFPDRKDNLLEVAYILKLTTDSEIRTQPNTSLLEYVATRLEKVGVTLVQWHFALPW